MLTKSRYLGLTLLVAALNPVGCVPASTMPLAVHPTPLARQDAGGVNFGAAYATMEDQDESVLSLPNGEGFVRFGGSRAQLELKASPQGGYVSARMDTADEGSGALAIIPSVGLGYYRVDGDERSQSLVMFNPNLTLLYLPAARNLYLGARGGVTMLKASVDGDGDSDSDSEELKGIGLLAGAQWTSEPFLYSVEVSVQRIYGDDDAVMTLVMPSLSVQLLR